MKHIYILFLVIIATTVTATEKWTVKPFERKAFIENKGQFNEVLPKQYQNFNYCIDNGMQVLFTNEGLTHVITKRNPKKIGFGALFMTEAKHEELERELDIHTQYITMKWLGANPNVTIENTGLQTTSYNYVIRPKESTPFTQMCKGYSKITYKNLYNGIDVEYIFTPKDGFKYNLIVSAGADVSQVKMQYNKDAKLLLDKGNISIKTIKGDIIDHAPITYATNNTGDILPSSFSIANNIVSFNVSNSSKQAITIDPWTVVPTLASGAFDNGADATGNIYVYGGNPGAYKVEKYAPNGGALLWSLSPTIDLSYYGDMLVESSGSFYLCEGFVAAGAHTYKYSSASTPIWTSTSNGSFREHWRLAINCVTQKVIVAGGGTTSPTLNIAEVDVSTGVLINAKSVYSGSQSDVSGLCVAENGRSFLKHSNPNIITFTDNTNTTLSNVNDGYNFGEISGVGGQAYWGSGQGNGFNMMALGGTNFMFTTDGEKIIKWDATTFVQLQTANIPGGVGGLSSGILADKCNNLFIGSNNGVYRYDFNLAQKEFHATPSAVFDITYDANGDIVASGAAYITNLNFGRESCGSIKTFITSNPCNAAINTVKVRPLLGLPPFTFLWNDGNTDSIRVNLGGGIHIVTIKDASCVPQFIKDTVEFEVVKAISVVQLRPCHNKATGGLTVGLTQQQQITSYTITPTVTSSKINDSTVVATGLADGTYAFHFVSNLGCSFDTIIKLNQYSPITSSTTALRRATCPGTLTGAGKVMASGSAPYTANGSAEYSYSWNTTPVQSMDAVSVVKEGTYVVTITDSIGCTKLDSVTIISNPNPTAEFDADSVCIGTASNFIDNSTLTAGAIKTWNWIFGGTAALPVPTSALQYPTFTFDKCNNASNNATLVITTDSGCVATLTKPVLIRCLPIPNFTFSNGCEKDQAITYTNTSTNGAGTTGALGYKWRLGLSPMPIVVTNPSQVYNAPGNYTINLNVTDKYGCAATVNKTVNIYPKPVANFMVDSVCLNKDNNFTNTTLLTVPTGYTDAINYYNWTYDYTTTYTTNASTKDAKHTYALQATQTIPVVALIVKTNNNCSDTITKPIIVWPLPKAVYTMTAPCFPNPITFINASTLLAGTNNSTMQNMVINWGDVSTQVVVGLKDTLTHNHTKSGNYNTALVIASNHGCKDSLTIPIVIHAKPVASFFPLPAKGCEPLCVTFNNTSTQNESPSSEQITQQNWLFGDYNAEKISDNKSTKLNPEHCYTNPSDTTQLHTTQLIVTTSEGCKDTLVIKNAIEVYPLPVAGFKAAPTTVDIFNPEIKITDKSHLAYTITWNYNDGNIAQITNSNPLQSMEEYMYTYKDSGSYSIKQLVKTNKGCADSVSVPVRVNPVTTLYTPNTFTPNGDDINDYFMVRGINIKTMSLIIFNRWGDVIGRIDSPTSKGWDGKDIRYGTLCQQEVYNWKMEYTDVFDIKHRGLLGTITLIK